MPRVRLEPSHIGNSEIHLSLQVRATWVLLIVLLNGPPLRSVDRCADARDDILRAKGMNPATQGVQARNLLMSAFVACPANPQNLELLAEAYDVLGDLALAGKYREQAMRVRGISSKPVVNLSSSSAAIERGQVTELKWRTTHATEVEITPELGRVAASGSKTVAPTATATYQLTAKGPGGSTIASLQVTVTIPRLSEANILDLLKNEVPKTRIAQLAAERGLTFDISPDVEQRLRSAGADDSLVEALKKARH